MGLEDHLSPSQLEDEADRAYLETGLNRPCAKCKHSSTTFPKVDVKYAGGSAVTVVCRHPKVMTYEYDLVLGVRSEGKQKPCISARRSHGACGVVGRYFEQDEPPAKSPAEKSS